MRLVLISPSVDTRSLLCSFTIRNLHNLSPSVTVKVKVKSLSRGQLFGTTCTIAHQDPPSMGFSRQEYWSGLPFLSLGHLPNPGIEPRSPALQSDALTSEPAGKPKYNNNGHLLPHISAQIRALQVLFLIPNCYNNPRQ